MCRMCTVVCVCKYSTPLQRYGVDRSCVGFYAALAAGWLMGGRSNVLRGMQGAGNFEVDSVG